MKVILAEALKIFVTRTITNKKIVVSQIKCDSAIQWNSSLITFIILWVTLIKVVSLSANKR